MTPDRRERFKVGQWVRCSGSEVPMYGQVLDVMADQDPPRAQTLWVEFCRGAASRLPFRTFIRADQAALTCAEEMCVWEVHDA